MYAERLKWVTGGVSQKSFTRFRSLNEFQPVFVFTDESNLSQFKRACKSGSRNRLMAISKLPRQSCCSLINDATAIASLRIDCPGFSKYVGNLLGVPSRPINDGRKFSSIKVFDVRRHVEQCQKICWRT